MCSIININEKQNNQLQKAKPITNSKTSGWHKHWFTESVAVRVSIAPFHLVTYVTFVTFPSIINELESMAAMRPSGLHSSKGCTTIGSLGLNTTSAWSPASMYGTPSTLALLVLFPIFQLIAVIWHGAFAVRMWIEGVKPPLSTIFPVFLSFSCFPHDNFPGWSCTNTKAVNSLAARGGSGSSLMSSMATTSPTPLILYTPDTGMRNAFLSCLFGRRTTFSRALTRVCPFTFSFFTFTSKPLYHGMFLDTSARLSPKNPLIGINGIFFVLYPILVSILSTSALISLYRSWLHITDLLSILLMPTITCSMPSKWHSRACCRVWPCTSPFLWLPFAIEVSNPPLFEGTISRATSACAAPEIMFLMKSRCPGASMMV